MKIQERRLPLSPWSTLRNEAQSKPVVKSRLEEEAPFHRSFAGAQTVRINLISNQVLI
jgi:anti-sigma-K factor RskA